MRTIFIALLLIVFSQLACVCFADEKSDCLSNCENDNRAKNMYCPPAGGYTDNDHNQCIENNVADYKNCIKTCSPPPATSPEATTLPAMPQGNPVTTDKQ
ncbi:MAG TPA: hypothetical protein VIU41_10350 [Geobacteraceae bacterium]